MMKEVGTVYETNDLSMFKILKNNRDVKEIRKQALIESIDKNGYITNPIIVNEKYEVIDGQGRLEACKELGSPIDYVIVPNIGIDECRVLNMNTTNWRIVDFIKSYAEEGMEDYKRIYELSKMGFGIRTYMFTIGLYGGSGVAERVLREGRAICSEETFWNAKEALEYLKTVKPFIEQIDGRKSDFESAVVFAYKDENCDNKRLSESLAKYYSTISNVINIKSATDEISKVYNRNIKGKERLYLSEDYDRFGRRY